MIIVKLNDLLDTHDKSLYFLQQKTGVSYPTLHRLSKNKTTSISFDVLEKICLALDCEITDLLEIKKD